MDIEIRLFFGEEIACEIKKVKEVKDGTGKRVYGVDVIG